MTGLDASGVDNLRLSCFLKLVRGDNDGFLVLLVDRYRFSILPRIVLRAESWVPDDEDLSKVSAS